jgi:hypothetical protein
MIPVEEGNSLECLGKHVILALAIGKGESYQHFIL